VLINPTFSVCGARTQEFWTLFKHLLAKVVRIASDDPDWHNHKFFYCVHNADADDVVKGIACQVGRDSACAVVSDLFDSKNDQL
jgi:hypothetical protein